MDIKTIEDFVRTELETAVSSLLDENSRVKVSYPPTIDGHLLDHPVGELMIVYSGDRFNPEQISGGYLIKRNNEIGVVVAVRKIGDRRPSFYVDFVIDSLIGKQVVNTNPNTKLIPNQVEFIEERNGVWYYGVTFTSNEVDQQVV